MRLLRSSTSDAVLAAAARANLAADSPANKADIKAAGGIPGLVRLLQSSTSDAVLEMAAFALCNLAADSPSSTDAIYCSSGRHPTSWCGCCAPTPAVLGLGLWQGRCASWLLIAPLTRRPLLQRHCHQRRPCHQRTCSQGEGPPNGHGLLEGCQAFQTALS